MAAGIRAARRKQGRTANNTFAKPKKNMKNETIKSLIGAGAALAMAAAILNPFGASARDKGAQALVTIPTGPSVAAVAPVMSCPMCKDEISTRVDTSVRGAIKPTVISVRHLCARCDTTVKVLPTGKNAATTVTHTCGYSTKEADCCGGAR
jgi:hypothetical protein